MSAASGSAAVGGTTDFRQCVVTQLLTYGLNRSMNEDEKECLAKQLAYPLDLSVPSLRELVIQSSLSSLRLTGGLP